jgi:hypothetical protein
MTERRTYGEQVIVVRDLLPAGRTLRLYRIVKTPDPEDPEFLDSLRSHYELGHHPPGPPRPAVLHMGLSMYRDMVDAIGTARRWPVIGEHLATLVLWAGRGFNIADTGHPGHVTVWGDPESLRAHVEHVSENVV